MKLLLNCTVESPSNYGVAFNLLFNVLLLLFPKVDCQKGRQSDPDRKPGSIPTTSQPWQATNERVE